MADPRLRGSRRRTPTSVPASRGSRRRVLSQNFLTDPGAVRAVLRAALPAPTDLVVEVGPGEGALTAGLARRARRLVAYELDPALAERLRRRFAGVPTVTCLNRDFPRVTPPAEPFTVVGNIPYAITAEIVDWCLRAPTLAEATLVTQLEYARKRTGGFGRWSRLTVTTWPRFEWTLLDRIDRTRFRPVPRVDSGVLRLRRRTRGLLPAAALPDYRRLVELGFSGVGGSLEASLRRAHPRAAVARALREARVERGTVVGYVTPDQWVTLYRHLAGGR